MSGRNFYNLKDAEMVAGSANFSQLITAGPVPLGLTAAQAAAFGTLNTTLQSAYLASREPTTRTPVAVAAKNTAKLNVRNSAKLLAQIIYATPTVTDAQLVSLGLLPRSQRAPAPLPELAPVLEIVSVIGRLVKIRVSNAEADTKRGKPAGTVGANVYSFVGDNPPTDPRQYHFEGLSTRATADVLFPDSVESGSTVWLSACWVTQRGQMLMSCAPVQFTIQGGAVRAAA